MSRYALPAFAVGLVVFAVAIVGTAMRLSDPLPPLPPTQTERVVTVEIRETVVVTPTAERRTPYPSPTRPPLDPTATATAIWGDTQTDGEVETR